MARHDKNAKMSAEDMLAAHMADAIDRDYGYEEVVDATPVGDAGAYTTARALRSDVCAAARFSKKGDVRTPAQVSADDARAVAAVRAKAAKVVKAAATPPPAPAAKKNTSDGGEFGNHLGHMEAAAIDEAEIYKRMSGATQPPVTAADLPPGLADEYSWTGPAAPFVAAAVAFLDSCDKDALNGAFLDVYKRLGPPAPPAPHAFTHITREGSGEIYKELRAKLQPLHEKMKSIESRIASCAGAYDPRLLGTDLAYLFKNKIVQDDSPANVVAIQASASADAQAFVDKSIAQFLRPVIAEWRDLRAEITGYNMAIDALGEIRPLRVVGHMRDLALARVRADSSAEDATAARPPACT